MTFRTKFRANKFTLNLKSRWTIKVLSNLGLGLRLRTLNTLFSLIKTGRISRPNPKEGNFRPNLEWEKSSKRCLCLLELETLFNVVVITKSSWRNLGTFQKSSLYFEESSPINSKIGKHRKSVLFSSMLIWTAQENREKMFKE